MNHTNFITTEYNEPFIVQRADPYIGRHTDGYYYFTASVPEYDRIIIRKSKTLQGLKSAEEIVIWEKHKSGIMSCHIWAPELHFINNKWYIYYAAGEIEDIWKIRPYVLECDSSDPVSGTWVEKGKMQRAEEDMFSFEAFSLDATIFEHKGIYYYVWAEKVGMGKMISNLYIAQMETPYKLKTSQILLTTPDYEWERVDFWVNEGPAVLKKNGKLFLTFSASATGEEYCMGMLTADMESDLLDPQSWSKQRYPVVKTEKEKAIYGPGHNCFTVTEEGKDVMVYHARQYDEIIGDPLYDPNRHTMLMELEWKMDGTPNFDFKNNFISRA